MDFYVVVLTFHLLAIQSFFLSECKVLNLIETGCTCMGMGELASSWRPNCFFFFFFKKNNWRAADVQLLGVMDLTVFKITVSNKLSLEKREGERVRETVWSNVRLLVLSNQVHLGKKKLKEKKRKEKSHLY